MSDAPTDPPADSPAGGPAGNPATGEADVIVYSTPFCAPCEALKRYLRERGVAFQVRDLMMDEDAADRLEARGIRSTPALEVGGEIYAGDTLNPERLREVLPSLA